MRFGLGLILALAIAGPCAAGIDVVVPPPVQVTPLEPGAKIAPVSLARMAASIPAGKVWAQIGPAALFCPAQRTLTWDANLNRFNDPDFRRVFREELKKAGFAVAGEDENLFADEAKASDLQLGALITDIRVKACHLGEVSQKERGSAVMHIEWQIYSVADAKVIARVPTDGGAQVGFMNGLLEQLLQQSFAENVRQLAASPEFRRVVLSGASAEAPPATAPIRVAYRKPAAPMPLKEDAQGVVLIRVGDGFGSGVLISPDGYILTNHHVAGASGHVRVRWADGSETVAEVVRSDRARDVALLKVDAVKGAPLPIRATPVELGETVYAIGTPVEHVLQNTVTRGIVSGMRLIEGHSYIQSDVPVSHGNSGGPLVDEKGAVVGLTDRGMDPSAGTLLNFFIPIGDALKALDVKPAG